MLDELTARGITWLTLRMRGKAELTRLAALPAGDWRTMRIERPGRYRHPRLHEDLITLPGINAKVRQIAYLTISLADAYPIDLQRWIRAEWLIENLVHHVRDVTFREDSHQARTGNGPAVMATLRNAAIGFHRANGNTNIARATRRANRRPHDLITAVTSGNTTMQ